jgi:hypothetical protein
MKTKIFLTGMALLAFTMIVSAQDPSARRGNGNGRCNGPCKGSSMIDNNKNGICDNFENRKGNSSGQRGNGNCNGTGQGQRQGKGRNFVDANGNGVCDYFEARAKK